MSGIIQVFEIIFTLVSTSFLVGFMKSATEK